jgi:hypothetical protein
VEWRCVLFILKLRLITKGMKVSYIAFILLNLLRVKLALISSLIILKTDLEGVSGGKMSKKLVKSYSGCLLRFFSVKIGFSRCRK